MCRFGHGASFRLRLRIGAVGRRRLARTSRPQPATLLAPPAEARPGIARSARGDRSGKRRTWPYRRAPRDRRRPAIRVCARRVGLPTRRPETCERAYADEPRRSSSKSDDFGSPKRHRVPWFGTVCVPCLASNSTRRGLVGPRLRKSGLGRPDSAPWSAAMPRGVSAAPSSVPPFELLESKLLPPHPSGIVSRGELISSLEGSRAPPSLSYPLAPAGERRRCSLNGPPGRSARSPGYPSTKGTTIRSSCSPISPRRSTASRRSIRTCSTHWRQRAPRLTGRSSRASERPWRGWMRTSSWCSTICICSTTRPPSTPSKR